MTKKTTVWYVGTSDNWHALYINGKSVFQNHNIDVREFMQVLREVGLVQDIDFHHGYVGEKTEEKAYQTGYLPDDFSEIEDDVD